MRSYAVIPPIVLDDIRRNHRYENMNGLLEDPTSEYKEHKNVNIWSEHEQDVFRDKYLQHPKNFVLIASYLEKKSVSDCIQYYYSAKKKENFKAQVKRRIRRPRAKGGGGGGGAVNNPAAAGGVLEVVGLNSTGVTTRGSVAALQKEQQQTTTPSCSNRAETNSITAPSSPTNSLQAVPSSCSNTIQHNPTMGSICTASSTATTTTSTASNTCAESLVVTPAGGLTGDVAAEDVCNRASPTVAVEFSSGAKTSIGYRSCRPLLVSDLSITPRPTLTQPSGNIKDETTVR